MLVDNKRMQLVNLVGVAREDLENAKWDLFLYDNRQKISEFHLRSGDLSFIISGAEGHGLVSDVPLGKCPFDGYLLARISAVEGGSNVPDRALYQCRECKVKYFAPLTEEESRKVHTGKYRQ